MTAIILYLIKVSIVTAILFIIFKVFLSRNTFHSLNRCVLLGIMCLSIIIPLINIQLPIIKEQSITDNNLENILRMMLSNNNETLFAQQTTTITTNHRLLLIFVVYLLGVGLLLIRHIIALIRINQLFRSAKRIKNSKRGNIYISSQPVEPFSIMKRVLINEADFDSDNKSILLHEQSHIAHHHSYDLMFSCLFTTLCWFNPFAWLLIRSLRDVHEFQADAEVNNNIDNLKEYYRLLIQHCVGKDKFELANNFEFENLQKRINMTTKKQSKNSVKWIYTCLLAGLTLAIIVTYSQPLQAKNFVLEKTESPDELMLNSSKNDADKEMSKVNQKDAVEASQSTSLTVEKSHQISRSSKQLEKRKLLTDSASTPLYIIDGVETNSEELNQLNFDKIENISVLKDESTLKIYGEKGKHGVITLETKQAKSINDDVLLIVDGVEMPMSALNTIEVRDIKNISVLKDKKHTQKYGKAGDNGIIIVTTKMEQKSNFVQ